MYNSFIESLESTVANLTETNTDLKSMLAEEREARVKVAQAATPVQVPVKA